MITNLLKQFALRFGMWGLVTACVGCSLIAWQTTRLYYEAQISTMQRDQAETIATARAADIETLQLAKRHGDVLTLQLQATESSLTKKEKELHDAITSKTTGRVCLSAGVVRMLNDTESHDAAGVSTSTPVAAAEDGPAASDTDIAQWASNARTQYEICRGRLNTLIDW